MNDRYGIINKNATWQSTNQGAKFDDFYDRSSLYVPNKFTVMFYGEYCTLALAKMITRSTKPKKQGTANVLATKHAWEAFSGNFVDSKNAAKPTVNMKWGCLGIDIPTTIVSSENNFQIDAIKQIDYSLVKSHSAEQLITITVQEDRHYNWYQFFNALSNEFFSPLLLKPRSSFQKLGISIGTYQGDSQPANGSQGSTLALTQLFEFNSATPSTISGIKMDQRGKEPATFTVSFKVINAFQGTYNNTFAGLRDNSHLDPRSGVTGRSGYDDGIASIRTNVRMSS